MTALVPLHFDSFDVRMVMLDGVPWWVLADVCSILDIKNHRHAASRLEDYQKGVAISDSLGGRQEMLIVNEAGIYALTMSSRKAEAKAFARWLFTEVLPSIRQHGQYPPPPQIPEITPDALPAPQPVQEQNPGTRASRFLEELCRAYRIENDAQLIKGFNIPKQALVWMRSMGTGEEKYLKRLGPAMAIAGCDMRYIEFGTRTYTSEERALIAALRNLEAPERALAFHRLAREVGNLQMEQEKRLALPEG